MSTSSSNFVSRCHFRMDGFFCDHGGLYRATDDGVHVGTLVTIEGAPVFCQACDGTGFVLTELGKSTLGFFETAGRPLLRRVIREVLAEQDGLNAKR